MDRDTVIRHLRAWAEGVDPFSGNALAPDHPGQRPDTLRVVFAALALFESDQPSPPVRSRVQQALSHAARNAGQAWSDADDQSLAAAFDAGTTIAALALQMERTRGAITARLVKLGKIEPPPGMRLRGESAPL